MVNGIKQWAKDCVMIQGVAANVVVNVTPTKSKSAIGANLVYVPNESRNNVTPTATNWDYRVKPTIILTDVPTEEKYGTDMIANMVSHEFGHVLGLWDAYGYNQHVKPELLKKGADLILAEAPPSVMVKADGKTTVGIDQISTTSVMMSQWYINYTYEPLLYEMMLYAWSTNSLQAFTPVLFSIEPSQALFH